MIVRRRLSQKTPVDSGEGGFASTATCRGVARSAKKRGVAHTRPACSARSRPRPNHRAAAVQAGVLPKARRPFAVYTQEVLQELQPRPSPKRRFAEIAARWRALDAEARKEYYRRSEEEFARQRGVAQARGIHLRRANCIEIAQGPPAGVPETEPTPKGQTFAVGPYECSRSKALGAGTYGLVLAAAHVRTGRLVALKLFKSGDQDDARHEFGMYQALSERRGGSGSALFLEVLDADPNASLPWLAFPMVGQSLSSHLASGPCNDESAFAIAAQLVMALSHLHGLSICHLDLKTSNILWCPRKRSLHLADLGMCERIPIYGGQLRFQTYCTDLYRPPELVAASSRERLAAMLTPAVDVWSAGCVVYAVVAGRHLMSGMGRSTWQGSQQTWADTYATRQHSDEYVRFVLPHLSRAHRKWQRVVRRCCHPQPEGRPKLKDVANGCAWVRHMACDPMPYTPP
jgi:hypothetical protein